MEQKKHCHWCGGEIDERETYWHLTQQGGIYLCNSCGWGNWKSSFNDKEDNKDNDGKDD